MDTGASENLKEPFLNEKQYENANQLLRVYNYDHSGDNDSQTKTQVRRFSVAKNLFIVDDDLSFTEAFYNLTKSSFPSIMALMFIFINDSVNLIFAGKYFSSDEISAIGLGTFYVNCLGFILGVGILGSVDTICSQAFGAKQYYVVGLFVNISKIILLCYSFFIIIPGLFFCETVLTKMGIQETNIISLSSEYVVFLVPYVIFSLQYNANVRYLQSMNIFFPGMFVSMITTILHPIWCYLLVHLFGCGMSGIALSMGLTSIIDFILITLYINYTKPFPKTKLRYTKECFQIKRIYDFLKLAIPSAIMFAADWLGFEIIILLSSYLNKASLAANVILFTFINLIGTIPLGLSLATATLVGNSIGGSKAKSAVTYTLVSIVFGCTIVLLIAIIIQSFSGKFPWIYTDDQEVANIISNILDIYVFFGVIDALQVILNGVVKGLGKQKPASILVIIILYPVSIPLSVTLAFLMNYGFEGLWISQLTAITLLAFSYITLIICVDWENIILRTIVRIRMMNEKLKQKGKILESKLN